MQSKLFIIEGPDGAGKTQMAQDLKKDITAKHPEAQVRIISFPHSGSFGYKKLKEILKDEALLYPPDIVQSLFIMNMISCADNVIKPFFKGHPEDHVMILDRSIISTIIYNTLNDGNIFQSILSHTWNLANQVVPGSMAVGEVDFDIINKIYTHINIIQPIEAVFFLLPPHDVLFKHSENRNSEEFYDTKEWIKKSYHAYSEFQLFLRGLLTPNILVNLQPVQERLKVPENKKSKYVRLSNWNDAKSESENYKTLREEILTKLNI